MSIDRKNLQSVYRDCSCSCLNLSHKGVSSRLCGWVHRKRHHGGLLFIDLRDDYGITQCVIEPLNKYFSLLVDLNLESVISVYGSVASRPLESYNSNLPTGEIELNIISFEVLSLASELPFAVFSEADYPEDIRLKNRFLDLRRKRLHSNIKKRSKIISSLRASMLSRGFTEFQTPILTASSPEGARDFLVPSRLHPGKFYALPQAPQQFKQLLMMSGFDRYFQIAPCFRDEDARSDRSPGEFYQLDIEMSFVEQKDVFAVVEPVLIELFQEYGNNYKVSDKFIQLKYKDAMDFYSTDKPDLRNPIKLCDVTDLFIAPEVSFRAFREIIKKGGIVRAIPAPGSASQPRSFFDHLNNWAKEELGCAGLGYIICEQSGDKLVGKGPIARFIPDPIWQKIVKRAKLKAGDSVFFACDKPTNAHIIANAARNKIANKLGIIKEKSFAFCWIVDFPMYEKTDDPPSGKGNITFSHNPFSMPQGGMDALENKAPLDILGYQYDIVCNGLELSSGAIRNHRVDILYKAFEIAGYGKSAVAEKFPGMLRALSYGTPPHGGIAPGIDRIVMMLTGESNLREVTAFPLNQQAQDLLMGAPSEVSEKQLKILSLAIKKQRGKSF